MPVALVFLRQHLGHIEETGHRSRLLRLEVHRLHRGQIVLTRLLVLATQLGCRGAKLLVLVTLYGQVEQKACHILRFNRAINLF